MADPTVLLPLSPRDAAIGGVGLTLAFVPDARPGDLDLDALQAAIERVVDKWRLLAGTVEQVVRSLSLVPSVQRGRKS